MAVGVSLSDQLKGKTREGEKTSPLQQRFLCAWESAGRSPYAQVESDTLHGAFIDELIQPVHMADENLSADGSCLVQN